jgi:hypothetical protein
MRKVIVGLVLALLVAVWLLPLCPPGDAGHDAFMRRNARVILERNRANYGHLPYDRWPEDIRNSDEYARRIQAEAHPGTGGSR